MFHFLLDPDTNSDREPKPECILILVPVQVRQKVAAHAVPVPVPQYCLYMYIIWHSWRTEGAECATPRAAEPGLCQLVSPERLAAAETACSRLLGPPFSACHDHVEPGLVYNSCLEDVCACRGSLSSCFCPLLAAYADRCSAKVYLQYIFTNVEDVKSYKQGFDEIL